MTRISLDTLAGAVLSQKSAQGYERRQMPNTTS